MFRIGTSVAVGEAAAPGAARWRDGLVIFKLTAHHDACQMTQLAVLR
jgi:hypothetical protein